MRIADRIINGIAQNNINLLTIKNYTIMKKFITTIKHPKASPLSVDIYEEDGSYFYEEDGDWFNSDWCNNPLEDCKKDAMDTLNQKYKGTYYSFDYGEFSEKQMFRAIQG